MKNALIIFKKEIKEVLKSRSIWVPSIILSLIFAVIMPIALSVGSGSLLKDPDIAKLFLKILPGYDPFTSLVMFLSKQLLVFLLLVPAMIPRLIAPTSI